MLANRRAKADGVCRRATGDEVSDVDVDLVRTAVITPFALHFHRGACTQKPDIQRFEWFDCAASGVGATMVGVETQVKRGGPSNAVSTAVSRVLVLPLVPMR